MKWLLISLWLVGSCLVGWMYGPMILPRPQEVGPTIVIEVPVGWTGTISVLNGQVTATPMESPPQPPQAENQP